ncbi:MAG: hypothetical protein IH604_03730 [Burkholderiales bacterium]|nr:hypothetical protein [Burkholderiales bacterium]
MSRKNRCLIALAAAYVVGLHLFVFVTILKTDLLERAGARLGLRFGNEFSIDARAFRSAQFLLDRIDQTMRKSPVVFMGDSIMEGLPPLHGIPRSMNLALGGSTSLRTAAMIGGYRNIDHVAAVVLGVGINDLCGERPSAQEFESRLRKLSAALPTGVRVVWSSILPVDPNSPRAACTIDPDVVRQANSRIAALCKDRAACIYSDGYSKLAGVGGHLPPQFHVGDGLHLSPLGYEVWSAQLRQDLVRAGVTTR